MTRKKGASAAEFMAKLNADPAFRARRAEEEDERNKRAAELRLAEAPLVEALRAAGREVDSAWDLVNTRGSYPDVLPILLEHLQRPYPPSVREGIARALAVPEATFARDTLVRLHRDESDARAKDGLAVALAVASGDEGLGALIALARDIRLGPSRLLLLSALEHSADPRARAALIDLGTDPELQKEVRAILRRVKRTGRRI